jgi:hypothetical protein
VSVQPQQALDGAMARAHLHLSDGEPKLLALAIAEASMRKFCMARSLFRRSRHHWGMRQSG